MTFTLDLSKAELRVLLGLLKLGLGRYLGNQQLQAQGAAFLDESPKGDMDALARKLSSLSDQAEIMNA